MVLIQLQVTTLRLQSLGDDKDSQYQLSGQVIGKHLFDKKSGPSAKVGLTYTMYTNDDDDGVIFDPTAEGNAMHKPQLTTFR